MSKENKISAIEVNAFARELASALSKNRIVWSWGANSYGAKIFNEMACLSFKVQGFLFKGVVNVCINRGTDTFEIYYSLKLYRKYRKPYFYNFFIKFYKIKM